MFVMSYMKIAETLGKLCGAKRLMNVHSHHTVWQDLSLQDVFCNHLPVSKPEIPVMFSTFELEEVPAPSVHCNNTHTSKITDSGRPPAPSWWIRNEQDNFQASKRSVEGQKGSKIEDRGCWTAYIFYSLVGFPIGVYSYMYIHTHETYVHRLTQRHALAHREGERKRQMRWSKYTQRHIRHRDSLRLWKCKQSHKFGSFLHREFAVQQNLNVLLIFYNVFSAQLVSRGSSKFESYRESKHWQRGKVWTLTFLLM